MNLPADFSDYTRGLMGEERYQRFVRSLSDDSPVAIRLNADKLAARPWRVPAADGAVGWCPEASYLGSRPAFTFDPLLHAGAYYVQEASSMFVHHVLRCHVHRPVCMLDLCAAPGGKSTAARAALPAGSVLFANEPVRLRAQVLAENLQKWGHPDVVVTSDYPRDYRKAGLAFDVILADVPCSGEGMFRKDPNAVAEWSRQHVFDCARLQRDIVTDAWECLRPGGLLIYATCTFNAQEDEENVAWIVRSLSAEWLSVPVDPAWGITGSLVGDIPVYRFIPGYIRGEGLFMAVLRKPLDGGAPREARQKQRPPQAVKGCEHLLQWLRPAAPVTLLREEDACWAIPTPWLRLYQQARQGLHVLHAGVRLATFRGKDLVPDHCLALSTLLRPGAFPVAALTYPQAIAYLRRESITLPADTPRGFVLVAYQGMPIGFVKNLGHRANNLYPPEWKIKSSHVPGEPPVILALP